DFGDTLVPDSTSAILLQHGVDPREFWTQRVRSLVAAGFDPAPAYLKLLLDLVGEGKPFGPLARFSGSLQRLLRAGDYPLDDLGGRQHFMDAACGLARRRQYLVHPAGPHG